MAFLAGSGSFLGMAGLSAIVLGILALAGFDPVSLLRMGATIVLTGSALAGVMLTFFRTA